MQIFRKKQRKSTEKERSKVIPFNTETWHYVRFNGELLDIDTIVACIDALARNLAKMELSAIRKDQDNITITDRTSDVAKVLRKPNPYQSQYDFIYKVAALYFATNNAYIWPEYDDSGNLINLWPINCTSAEMYRKDGFEFLRFKLHRNHMFTVPYSQIIHLRNHYMKDDIFGDSNHAFSSIAELMDAQQQGIKGGIKNSALIRGLLKAAQVMKEEDIKEARDRFVQDNFAVQNNGGVLFIDGKFDYTNIESKPYIVDADSMKFTQSQAYSYFGVNEDFLQNKFNSEGYEAVYEGRLEPWAIQFMQALTDGIFTSRMLSFGNQIVANMARLKYQSLGTISNMISVTKELGLFTRDEYREMLGYEPLGPERGGDEIMIATNNYDSSTNNDSSESEGSGNSDNQEGEEQ